MINFKKGVLVLSALLSVLFVNSCTKSGDGHIDYVSSEDAKLVLDYEGKDFLNDGIELVDLKTSIDGDTAHFVTKEDNELIKCRFYGVDTPESTGKIQPYGKAASNFTKEKLKNADENGTIVISTPADTYQTPSPDSTGSRYLALVWINEEKQNASFNELKLLNLMLVQEGYSEVKNANEMPRLEPVFRSAWEQAKSEKLNMFSGEDDPLFNYGDYQDASLLDMKIELEKQIEASRKGETYENKYSGAKVRVVGTVAGYANKILFIQNFYSQENGARVPEGEYAGINVFTGMSAISSKFTKTNTYLQLCGTCVDDENFGFQITGVSFATYGKDENDAKVIISAADNTDEFKLQEFEKSLSEVNFDDYSTLFSPVRFKEQIIITDGYESDNKLSLYFTDTSGKEYELNIYLAFIYKPDDSKPSLQWTKVEDFVGKTFTLSGIVSARLTQKGEYQLQVLPRNNNDFVVVE